MTKRKPYKSSKIDRKDKENFAVSNVTQNQQLRRVVFSSEVNAVIVAALLGILGYMLGRIDHNFNLLDSLIRSLRIQTIELQAENETSGSGYRGQDLFSAFEQPVADIGVGDIIISTSNITSEVQAKVFITFSFFEFPEYSDIEFVEIQIPCTIKGDPSLFSKFHIRLLKYNGYNETAFDSYTSDYYPFVYYDVYYKKIKSLLDNCKTHGNLVLVGRELTEYIRDLALAGDRLQFVLWFSDTQTNQNGRPDAIIIPNPPVMKVKYLP
jgi:hypothetical protein